MGRVTNDSPPEVARMHLTTKSRSLHLRGQWSCRGGAATVHESEKPDKLNLPRRVNCFLRQAHAGATAQERRWTNLRGSTVEARQEPSWGKLVSGTRLPFFTEVFWS